MQLQCKRLVLTKPWRKSANINSCYSNCPCVKIVMLQIAVQVLQRGAKSSLLHHVSYNICKLQSHDKGHQPTETLEENGPFACLLCHNCGEHCKNTLCQISPLPSAAICGDPRSKEAKPLLKLQIDGHS